VILLSGNQLEKRAVASVYFVENNKVHADKIGLDLKK
jgi:hypothetical protein